MSCNVGNTYIDFSKKNITKCMKLILDNKFDKKIFSSLLEIYINVRYYNYYDAKYKNFEANINYYLRNKAKELLENNENKTDIIKYTFHLFKYVLYIDDVINDENSLNDIVDEILIYRNDVLKINDKNFKTDFNNLVNEATRKKIEFFDQFKTSKFLLVLKKTNNKNILYSLIDYDIKFPKIYSSYSKNKIFNTGIVNENKYFIEYYLISNLILKEIISGDFNRKYIVNFCNSLFEKEEKVNGLLNIINNDAIKDKIIIMFLYKDYLKYKDKINALINLGYKIAILIDEDFELNEINKRKLDIFNYIIINETMYRNTFDNNKLIVIDK